MMSGNRQGESSEILMKHGTQSDPGEGALVDSDRLVTHEQATEIAVEVRDAYNKASAEAAEIGRKLDAASAAKHRRQSDPELRRTVEMMLAALCIFIAGGLSWILLLASLGGSKMAMIGFAYGIVIAFPAMYVGGIGNETGAQK